MAYRKDKPFLDFLVGRTRFELVTNGLKVIGFMVFCGFVLSFDIYKLLIIIDLKFNIVLC